MSCKVEKMGEHRGYDFLVVLQEGGWRCGYVRLPEEKPFDVRCHGGITFSDYVEQNSTFPKSGYWVGFDCAHSGDSYDQAGLLRLFGHAVETPSYMKGWHVWTPDEVLDECKSIIDQLIDEPQPTEFDNDDYGNPFEPTYDKLMRLLDNMEQEDAND